VPEYDPLEVEHHEQSTWESAADIYADTAGLLTARSGQSELAIEFGEIEQGNRVLDLGCGPGQLTVALSNFAGAAEGVDFSENMIRVARSAYPDLNFQVANGEQLPFEDSTFDVVVCNYTAHHFARPDDVFREVLRTLKPGGRVVVIHPIQAEQASWGSFAEELCEVLAPEQLPSGPLVDIDDAEAYESLLSRCGYANVRCEKRVKPVVIPDID
jgi:ubiquinone/menaquinone biosynthesis C-methylase UbiE